MFGSGHSKPQNRIDSLIGAGTRIVGDVHYKTLEIQLGAVVEGRLIHLADASEKVVAFKLGNVETN